MRYCESYFSPKRRYRLEFLESDLWGRTFTSLAAALKAARTDKRSRHWAITDQKTGRQWWHPDVKHKEPKE